MKKFLNVLGFELNSYFKQKGYIISTIIIAAILVVGLSLPSFIDLSGIIPQLSDGENIEDENKEEEEKTKYIFIDKKDVIVDVSLLESAFPNSEWKEVEDREEGEKLINSEDEGIEAGFIINDYNNYNYLVENKSMHSVDQYTFEEVLKTINRIKYANENNLDFNEMQEEINLVLKSEINILGKDSGANFFYVYVLVFVLYMIVLIYGQMIAISVTTEKSNRSMEILVTSASCSTLICGKVLAALSAAIIQISATLGLGIITYSINRDAWNGLLDNVFKIPTEILVPFIYFGVMGIAFYAFIFGALGALVSKTEDIGSSVSPIMFVFIASFLVSIFGMTGNPDSIVIKIASYIPCSSPMAMLVRVAMGEVATIEVIISGLILVISTVLVAIGSIKLYRMGTLRYGNPVKLKSAFKIMKSDK